MSAQQTLNRPVPARQADTAGTPAGQAKPEENGKGFSSALVSVVEAAQHLCHLLEMENDALRSLRFADIEPLQEKKAALSRLYEQGMKQIAKAGPEAMKSLSPAVRDQLLALATKLDELVGSNGRLLKAQIEANQRVLKAVVDATRKHQASESIYDRDGMLGFGRRKGVSSVAVSVDKTL